MKKTDKIITGRLSYRNVDFLFVFDGEDLHLIPPKEIKSEWIMTSLGMGISARSEQLKMESPYLVGSCNENGYKYVFFTEQGDFIKNKNILLIVKIIGYLECRIKHEAICRMSFFSPEINCIYPVSQGGKYDFESKNEKSFREGIVTFKTIDFESTKTEKRMFEVDKELVSVYFGVATNISLMVNESPISLNSFMSFEFNPTLNYELIIRLWTIAKAFISFLCYRNNVTYPIVKVTGICEDGKILNVGELHIIGEKQENELKTLKQRRYIEQLYINGSEGLILTDLAKNILYTRHIPDSYSIGKCIDASRFIMITAAFEWEFRRQYPQGIPKTQATENAENEAENEIQKLIDKSAGKLKKKYQFLRKLIKGDTLQNEVIKIGKDYDNIIGSLGRYLYGINNEQLLYNKMGERIANQRNNFAHGNLDKEFIGISLLDLMYMEYIIYAMQLKKYGVTDNNIRKAINDLFHLKLALDNSTDCQDKNQKLLPTTYIGATLVLDTGKTNSV